MTVKDKAIAELKIEIILLKKQIERMKEEHEIAKLKDEEGLLFSKWTFSPVYNAAEGITYPEDFINIKEEKLQKKYLKYKELTGLDISLEDIKKEPFVHSGDLI